MVLHKTVLTKLQCERNTHLQTSENQKKCRKKLDKNDDHRGQKLKLNEETSNHLDLKQKQHRRFQLFYSQFPCRQFSRNLDYYILFFF